MVKIDVQGALAVFNVQGLHKLWSFKNRLEVPLAHIKAVRADPNVGRRWWKGVRLPGTHIPRMIAAGTFYAKGKRSFWDTGWSDRAIVVELNDESYDELIVEVDDPSAEVERLSALLPRQAGDSAM